MFRLRLTTALGALLSSSLATADIIDGEDLADPTRPIYSAAVSSPEDGDVMDMSRNVVPSSYEVSFVRASNTRPIAIINDQRVTVGDVIGGATVVAIDRNGVTLSVNEQERRINLFGNGVKSPATATTTLP